MPNKNTSSSQDREILEAETAPHISNLVAIINDLDEQIAAWKKAADEWQCSTPEELTNRIHQLPETY